MSGRRRLRRLGFAVAGGGGGAAPSLALTARLERLVLRGRVSAVAALAVAGDDAGVAAAAGAAAGRGEPLFDLASLTKLWTASLALRLDVLGRLPLATPIGELWPEATAEIAALPLESLLRHRAGLPSWAPLYRLCRQPAEVASLVAGGRLGRVRRGVYGDLGFILWGLSAERALGERLDRLLAVELAGPLGLEVVRRRSQRGVEWLACQLGNGREVELAADQGIRLGPRGAPAPGEVQDGNARFLGGLAGHAGLFASPRAMSRLAGEWLRPRRLWPAEAARRALAVRGSFALGWRRATRRGSAGPALAPGGLGHVGFTGGSLWIDPAGGGRWILLAHRSRLDVRLAADRRWFHATCRQPGFVVASR